MQVLFKFYMHAQCKFLVNVVPLKNRADAGLSVNSDNWISFCKMYLNNMIQISLCWIITHWSKSAKSLFANFLLSIQSPRWPILSAKWGKKKSLGFFFSGFLNDAFTASACAKTLCNTVLSSANITRFGAVEHPAVSWQQCKILFLQEWNWTEAWTETQQTINSGASEAPKPVCGPASGSVLLKWADAQRYDTAGQCDWAQVWLLAFKLLIRILV